MSRDDKDKLGELLLKVTKQKDPVAVVAIFELDENGILVLSSAELPHLSPLIEEYIKTDQVNFLKLQSMIESGQIKLKDVTIDTNK